jgi:DNA-binding Lrp family transcriptional regulator
LDTNKKNHPRVFESIRTLPGVVEVHNVVGDYNMVVKVSAEDVEAGSRKFLKSVRDLPGVRQIKTLIPTAR